MYVKSFVDIYNMFISMEFKLGLVEQLLLLFVALMILCKRISFWILLQMKFLCFLSVYKSNELWLDLKCMCDAYHTNSVTSNLIVKVIWLRFLTAFTVTVGTNCSLKHISYDFQRIVCRWFKWSFKLMFHYNYEFQICCSLFIIKISIKIHVL